MGNGKPAWIQEIFDASSARGYLAGIVVLGAIILVATLFNKAIGGEWTVLSDLRDQAYARGLITFSVTFGTLALAVILVVSAIYGDAKDDARFRQGREIFSVLAGVLGTIVGFYFGAAQKDAFRPTLAPIRFLEADGAVSGIETAVQGGAAPYRYSIAVGAETKIDARSKDGWIVEATLLKGVIKGRVTVTAWDRTDARAEVSADIAPK